MPRYDYVCPVCGTHVTRTATVFDRDAQDCEYHTTIFEPAPRLVRQPSAPAFVVTGYNAKNGYSK